MKRLSLFLTAVLACLLIGKPSFAQAPDALATPVETAAILADSDWSHIVPFGDKIFFYKQHNGVVVVGHMGSDGKVTTLHERTLDKGWSHIVALSSSRLLFYTNNSVLSPAGTASLLQVSSTGKLSGLADYSFDPDWSHIVPAGDKLFFYKQHNGVSVMARLESDFKLTTLRERTIDKGWTHIVAATESRLLFYTNKNVQNPAGTAAVVRVNDSGSLSALANLAFDTDWTHIVWIGVKHLFYKSASGLAVVGQMDDNGKMATLEQRPIDKGWTHIAALSSSYLLFYTSKNDDNPAGTLLRVALSSIKTPKPVEPPPVPKLAPVAILVNGQGDCCMYEAHNLISALEQMGVRFAGYERVKPQYTISWNNLYGEDEHAASKQFIEGTRNFKKEVKQYIDALPVGTPLILIGHSFGGDSILDLLQDTAFYDAARYNLLFVGVIDPVDGFAMRETLKAKELPRSVQYFFNRWQENEPWPMDFWLSGEVGCLAVTCDDSAQNFSKDANGVDREVTCADYEITCPGYRVEYEKPSLEHPLGRTIIHPGTKKRRLAHQPIAYDPYIQQQMIDRIRELLGQSPYYLAPPGFGLIGVPPEMPPSTIDTWESFGIPPNGDVNCDIQRDIRDALLIQAGNWQALSVQCPPLPAGSAYPPTCDVTGDGLCDRSDATFVQNCEVGMGEPAPRCPLAGLQAPQVPASLLPAPEGTPAATVSIASVTVPPGQIATILVTLTTTEALGIGAATIEVRHDPTALKVISCAADPEGRFDLAVCNPRWVQDSTLGVVRMAVGSRVGISGTVTVAQVGVEAISLQDTVSDLNIEVALMADSTGAPMTVGAQDGQASIRTPVAAADKFYLPLLQR
jgi:hypothetical protein